MAGNKKFNTDLDITGKIKVTNVPNRAGTVMTYDITSKEISTRTHSEIISDLGLITATNIAAAYYTKTQLQTSGQSAVHWGNVTSKPTTLSGYGITDAIKSNGTINNNIDLDWGEGFTTFDSIPSGTPPLQSPNIRTVNIGPNFARRTQLAFDFVSDLFYLYQSKLF